jgi:4-hydroxy-3-polyprenylbenzoate decarboxylase
VGLETSRSIDEVEALADVVHPIRDISAGPASGSFPTSGMLIAPCSIRALSAIAHSHSADLLTRAADVTLKERRPLVLMVRETPLHLGHLRLMATVTEIGGVIFPPVPAFYEQPVDLEDLVTGTTARALAQLGMEVPGLGRWEGPGESPAPGLAERSNRRQPCKPSWRATPPTRRWRTTASSWRGSGSGTRRGCCWRACGRR